MGFSGRAKCRAPICALTCALSYAAFAVGFTTRAAAFCCEPAAAFVSAGVTLVGCADRVLGLETSGRCAARSFLAFGVSFFAGAGVGGVYSSFGASWLASGTKSFLMAYFEFLSL